MTDLTQPEVNISKFMFSRGIFTDVSGATSIPAGLVLWDTGNGATSFISEEFYRANKDFLEPMSEDEDSHISLADVKTACHITKSEGPEHLNGSRRGRRNSEHQYRVRSYSDASDLLRDIGF